MAKNKSPLLVGVGEGFNVIASDALAMLQTTNQYKEIHDHEIVIVKRDTVETVSYTHLTLPTKA